MPFTDEEVKWVLEYAGLHPFFIQRVCYALFETKRQLNGKVVDFQEVRNMAYKDLLPYFADTWEHLSLEHRIVIEDEARRKDHQQRSLPELSESAFFRQFVRDTCQIQLFQMTPEELENALKKMNDYKALGETNLRLMKAVSQRLENDTQHTPIDRGRVIREVLNEALEQLKGNRLRTDSDPEWRLYNILYYRYFRYDLKHEQIAARLEFTSLRKYYRERNKAINVLLNFLFEEKK